MNKPKTYTCAREECGAEYVKKTHNQKYCNDECCRLATNARMMVNYYARRDQRSGKERFCVRCEKTKLSRYNDSLICSGCKISKEAEANNTALNLILSVTV